MIDRIDRGSAATLKAWGTAMTEGGQELIATLRAMFTDDITDSDGEASGHEV